MPELSEHALQANIGPGTYNTLEHHVQRCGWMIGSAVGIMNSRPGGRPHCRHLGEDSLRNHFAILLRNVAINDPPSGMENASGVPK